ncbi:MAG: HEPN domain-containing protein [Candidatus Verstraetearchaeota archaeon]|nr:HEPN domain-containing protein [Candidatus Verstraetearchaeota archaeon]
MDPLNEALYRFRLARGHLARAERLLALGDRAGAVHFAQLAVENFAKAIVALYEVPTWSHDPSSQLLRLLNRVPQSLAEEVCELASIARELAPEHGRSAYGEPSGGLTPDDIYTEAHARGFVAKALRAREIVAKVFEALKVAVD